ncbi:MAG: T9SS type A sorting domain-containing protein [Chitinophagales bacterium]|nr:T9SS type A sorting domain-containing protein [Chitinophagales bacterium]
MPILFTNDINSGFPEPADTVDVDDITNTDVTISNGNIFVVWEDDNSGTVKYRKGTYNINTSVPSISVNTPINIYPNPSSSGEIFIGIDKIQNANATCTISNFLGQNLIESNSTVVKGLLKVNISSLTSGTYLLKIIAANQTFVSKIVKQ